MKCTIHIYIGYATNISSEMNLKFAEYREISKKKLLEICQELENSVKPIV